MYAELLLKSGPQTPSNYAGSRFLLQTVRDSLDSAGKVANFQHLGGTWPASRYTDTENISAGLVGEVERAVAAFLTQEGRNRHGNVHEGGFA